LPRWRWSRGKTAPADSEAMIPSASARLQGLRIFIVEDDPRISTMLEDMLVWLGCVPVGVAPTIERGLALASAIDAIDVAILDVNIGSEMVFPVADLLLDRDVACVFSTGHDTELLRERYPLCGLLNKPYVSGRLTKILLASQDGD
jgi:CheY-like chemotaxis protein